MAASAVISSCGSEPFSAGPPAGRVTEYFEGLSAALSNDDVYGVLDFYAVDAQVQPRKGGSEGSVRPIRDLLVGNRADLAQQLVAVAVGADEALTIIRWTAPGDFGAIVAEMNEGRISGQSTYVDIASLASSLRASPLTVDAYARLADRYAAAWTNPSDAALAELYGKGAAIVDGITGLAVTGRTAISQLARRGDALWTVGALHGVAGDDGEPPADEGIGAHPAVFLDPSQYGRDPQGAVVVFDVVEDGCRSTIGVRWVVEDGLIVAEDRYTDLESLRLCSDRSLPSGWWTDLEMPGPRDELVTGTVSTPGGRVIPIHNGTPELEQLAEWGIARFSLAGLDEPSVTSITFEPTRKCEGVFGRAIEVGDSHDVVLCVFGGDLCRAAGECEVPLSTRVAMLHELGHVWMNGHIDDRIESQVLEIADLPAWRDDGAPWARRGSEFAAEVVAWGLADEPFRLEQLGRPPCQQAVAVFEAITGVEALQPLAACTG